MSQSNDLPKDAIAIIGMDCRFPMANNTAEYWTNLVNGRECITFFTDEELRSAGIQEETLRAPNYVKAAGLIENADLFDNAFFGYTPAESVYMDPQQCLFLETCWHALEDAGYNPYTYPGAISVFGGTRLSTYYVNYMCSDLAEYGTARFMQGHIGTDRDHLCTRVSYKLNLRGPAFNLQCACSTSLVSVHLGCQSLLNYESDMALAGASGIDIPQEHGHFYQEGMIFAPDGHCRPYDAKAEGIVSGNGVGVVLLKRLEDAIADRDEIYAIILGSALNNDGSAKVAYPAPSLEGQSEVIAEALGVSHVDPTTIAYIEGHGTGTYLGDPLEVEALRRIYGKDNPKRGYCALGSVKSNVGHLEVAAGIASLIKAVLAVRNGKIPPTCHFTKPNPRINFDETPFFVNTQTIDWPKDMPKKRAAVSSFGVGGTNAHIILEEAPKRATSLDAQALPNPLFVLSARSEAALEKLRAAYGKALRDMMDMGGSADLTDICHTSQEGRAHHSYRLALTAKSVEDLATKLAQAKIYHHANAVQPVFLFTGQGAQRTGMGRDLAAKLPFFSEELTKVCAAFDQYLDHKLLDVMWDGKYADSLENTAYTQPALFAIEYALATTWMHLGVLPLAMGGHSIGEYVAATLAHVFSLEDAVKLVAARGKLIASLPLGGGMSALLATEEKARELLAASNVEQVDIAAINGSAQCVLSGPKTELARVETMAAKEGLTIKALPVSHAFHSNLMRPILEDFRAIAKTVSFAPPDIPLVSNVTGTLADPSTFTTPEYWVDHIRSTVRFNDGLRAFATLAPTCFLEIGPKAIVTQIAQRERAYPNDTTFTASLHAQGKEWEDLCESLAALYRAGVTLNFAALAENQAWGRVHLPLYPFEGQAHGVDASFEGIANKRSALSPQSLFDKTSAAMADFAKTSPDRPGKDYEAHAKALETFCTGYVIEALENAQVFQEKAFQSEEELAEKLNLPKGMEQLFSRMLESLVAQGLLTRRGATVGELRHFDEDNRKTIESSLA
ncbi:MAG: type I polyketide synthase [Desulfovibrionaceae bacterium]|nr:type I polyketide synthase [Desulfovibrionaceae bacterium]